MKIKINQEQKNSAFEFGHQELPFEDGGLNGLLIIDIFPDYVKFETRNVPEPVFIELIDQGFGNAVLNLKSVISSFSMLLKKR